MLVSMASLPMGCRGGGWGRREKGRDRREEGVRRDSRLRYI